MKICSKCNKKNEDVEGNYCIFCGEKLINVNVDEKILEDDTTEDYELIQDQQIKQNTNKILKLSLIISIIIIFIVSGLAIYFKVSDNSKELEKKIATLDNQIKTLKKENKKLSSENNSLNQQSSSISSKIKFFDEKVVFVLDGYGNYYYTYDQMRQVTQGKDFIFWAYNLEQAIDLGYRAWK